MRISSANLLLNRIASPLVPKLSEVSLFCLQYVQRSTVPALSLLCTVGITLQQSQLSFTACRSLVLSRLQISFQPVKPSQNHSLQSSVDAFSLLFFIACTPSVIVSRNVSKQIRSCTSCRIGRPDWSLALTTRTHTIIGGTNSMLA